ncbi:MAG: hypothetical protein ACRDY7_15860, partial [Acidimicrobiia bacterium]
MTTSAERRLRTNRSILLPAVCAGMAVCYARLLWNEKWISDDGYIYLVYAKNVLDHGEFAFNLGEPVDAATGFLWLLALTAAKVVFFFLDYRQATFVLSFACAGTAFLVLAREALRTSAWFVVALGCIFFTPFVVSFSTSGLETPMVLLVAVAIYVVGRRRFHSPWLAVIMGAAPLVRPEFGLVLVGYLAVVVLSRAIGAAGISLATLGLLTLARFACFGDVLPNTAFVKATSETFGQGGHYLYEFWSSYPYFGVMAGAAVAMAAVISFRSVVGAARRGARLSPEYRFGLFILGSAAALTAWVYRVGGDFMHGRFMLVPFVFVVLTVVDLGPPLLGELGRKLLRRRGGAAITPGARRAAIGAVAVTLAFVAAGSTPLVMRGGGNWYEGIVDEQEWYGRANPRLHAWSGPNPFEWAVDGGRLNRLSRRVGVPVGFAGQAIGQLGFYRDSADVYVFDRWSLTRVAGSMIDSLGYFERMGHNAVMPTPLMLLEDRLTLLPFPLPDAALSDLLRFEFEGEELLLVALGDVDAYVAAGLLPPGTWAALDGRVRTLLSDEWIDRNVIFALAHRYPPHRPLYGEIRSTYDYLAQDGARSWISWYENHRAVLDAASAINDGERRGLPGRYQIYWNARSTKPIRNTFQSHSWKGPRRGRCDLELAGADVRGESLTSTWRPQDRGAVLELENAGPDTTSAEVDVTSLVESQCGGPLDTILLDWEMRSVTGTPLTRSSLGPGETDTTFRVKPFAAEHGFYRPGPQLRLSVAEAGGQPLRLAFPLEPGQGYSLWLS